MTNLYTDNTLSIGRTPLIKLNRIVNTNATVFGKIESRNPAGSIKCRIGAAMVSDAEERGLLKPGMEIIEPTSGNTGASRCRQRAAIRLFTMPREMSLERRKILQALVPTSSLEAAKGCPVPSSALRLWPPPTPNATICRNSLYRPTLRFMRAHHRTGNRHDTNGSSHPVSLFHWWHYTGISRFIKHTVGKNPHCCR